MLTIGSRRQVFNGTAKRTSGGLTKNDLMMSHGRIVSKSKHISAKKEMRLLKYGYGTRKGKFGAVKLKGKGRSRSMRGGSMAPLSPAGVNDGFGTKLPSASSGAHDSVDVQIQAGMAGGRRRHHSRRHTYRHRGGSGMKMLSPGDASWNGDAGQGITNFGAGSTGVQIAAGMAGGRRRRRHRQRGGTTKPMPLSSTNPQIAAINA